MRYSTLIKFKNYTFFAMLSSTQRLKGITSKVGEDKHIVLWDLDNYGLQRAISTLLMLQTKYDLGEIFLLSDKANSVRAICFTIKPFRVFMKILLDTPDIDHNYLFWTMQKGQATIRLSAKKDRIQPMIMYKITGRKESIPPEMIFVEYDTGIDKRGRVLKIG